jgi:carbamoyl-phosphate synthase large subunit
VAGVFVKTPVFPFMRFPGVDTILGPEMKSTGEVMGLDQLFGPAFAKALLAADVRLPRQGRVFVSVRDADKRSIVSLCSRLATLGYELLATTGTYRALRNNGVPVQRIDKVHEGRPHVIDRLKNGEIQLIFNTPSGRLERSDDTQIRAQAVLYKIPCITNISGAAAVIQALEAMRRGEPTVLPIQEYHAQLVK